MALSTVPLALAQYNANLDWDTDTNSARLALEALRFLIVNQPEQMSIQGRTIVKNLKELQEEKGKIETMLGVGQPKANGRRRFLKADLA